MIGKDWKSVSVSLLSHFPKKKKERKKSINIYQKKLQEVESSFLQQLSSLSHIPPMIFSVAFS